MKKSEKIIVVLKVVLMLIYVIFISKKQIENDSLYDIKFGEEFVNSGVVRVDKYSIHDNLKSTTHHFLESVITYEVYTKFGFDGLYVLQIILIALLAFGFYSLNKLFIKNKKLAYYFLFTQLIFMRPFISIRAQMYGFLFIILEIIFIEKFLKTKKFVYLVLLTLLPVAIVNFDGGIIYFYHIVIFVYLLNYIKVKFFKFEYDEEYVKNLKYLFIPLVVGTLLTVINPYGFEALTYPIKTLSDTNTKSFVKEFCTPNITNYYGLLVFLHMFIYANVYICTRKNIKISHMLLLLGTTFMSLIGLRYFAFCVICSAASLGYVEDIILNIEEKYFYMIEESKKSICYGVISGVYALFFCIIVFCFAFVKSIKGDYLVRSFYPISAVEYIKENIDSEKRIFNSYNVGSYLLFNGIKVFIDSRGDLYTPQYNKDTNVYNDFIDAYCCRGDYIGILEKYDIDYLLVENETAIAKNITRNENYEKVYEDDYFSVIVKKN